MSPWCTNRPCVLNSVPSEHKHLTTFLLGPNICDCANEQMRYKHGLILQYIAKMEELEKLHRESLAGCEYSAVPIQAFNRGPVKAESESEAAGIASAIKDLASLQMNEPQ